MPHINKDIDWVTGYYLVYQNTVLLVEHKRQGIWTCPGGHIELTEDPEEALLREIWEEMGLKPDEYEVVHHKEAFLDREGFKSIPLPAFINIHAIHSEHRHIGLQYFVRTKTDRVKLLEDEHRNMKWFSEADLEDAQYCLLPEIKFYAKEALRRLGT